MNATETLAPVRVGPELNGMPMTPEEFDAVQDWDEDYRYELVRGVLIVVPPPSSGERTPNDELGYLFRVYRDSHAQGASLDDTTFEHTIRTSTGRRRADRVVWAGLGRNPDHHTETPTIAIEFVSKRKRDWKRDHQQKRDEYAEVGICEYWVIDRFRRQMTVYRGTSEQILVSEGEVYRTELLPGFELPLAPLLAVADRCAEPEK